MTVRLFSPPIAATLVLAAALQIAITPANAGRDQVRHAQSWSIQLQGDGRSIAKRDSDVAVVDPDEVRNPAKLKRTASGKTRAVLAYVSIGEAEEYRSYMKHAKNKRWMTSATQGWKGNYKVRYWDPEWKAIVKKQVKAALDAGYDGVYLDRVDTYERMKAPGGSRKEMVKFVKEISADARRHNSDAAIAVQNAEELLDDKGYVDAIDAISKEDLYHGIRHDRSRNDRGAVSASVRQLKKAKAQGKGVHVIEYLDGEAAAAVRAAAKRDGFAASTSNDRLLRNASAN